jgi:hypothetical protein
MFRCVISQFDDAVLVAAAVLAATAGASIWAAEPEDSWRNPKRITREQDYTVVFRNGNCAHGTLVSVREQTAVLSGGFGKDRLTKRTDVVRFSDGPGAPTHTRFSAGGAPGRT